MSRKLARELAKGDVASQHAAAVKLQAVARGRAARLRVQRGKLRTPGTRHEYLYGNTVAHWLVAAGSDTGLVSVFDTKTGKAWGLLSQSPGHRGAVIGLKFLPDSKLRNPQHVGLKPGHDALPADDEDGDDEDGAVIEAPGFDELAEDVLQEYTDPTPGDFDCARLVSVGSDGTVMVWRMGTMKVLSQSYVGVCGACATPPFPPLPHACCATLPCHDCPLPAMLPLW